MIAALALAATACGPRAPQPEPPAVADIGGLHVLMINGGGSKHANYQSHAIHIEQLLTLLGRAGLRSDAITVFSSDGEDPDADLAVGETYPTRGRWRLRGTSLERPLVQPLTFANTEIPGVELRPATEAALLEWFERAAGTLHAGDTLLLYVTDHGDLNRKDPGNNTITLWGPKERLSVDELIRLLGRLDRGVRVVTLMSQCFSGAFARLIEVHAVNGLPSGNLCGYFSSTAERPAYGCYPENRGKKNVGHSFRTFHHLAETGSLAEAHRRVLVSDDTPDVPMRTSDHFIIALLEREAEKEDRPFEEYADGLLRRAWRDKGRWEREIRLLDRIGQAYGYFSPRSLAEIAGPDHLLPKVAGQMRNLSNAWKGTLADANVAQLERFLKERPDWAGRLTAPQLAGLGDDERRETAAALIGDLRAATRTSQAREERLATLHRRSTASAATSYRMSVRLGVVERMRHLLLQVAGQLWLSEHPDSPEAKAYHGLQACEDLRLPPVSAAELEIAAAEPFPNMEDDVRRGTAALPAWMGIRFQAVGDERRDHLALEGGAATVAAVFDGSPAEKAGLEPGDIVLGPPGRPFTERGEVRSWTMLSDIGVNKDLEILRNGERRVVHLTPGEFPLEWPELPGPPKVGDAAPEVKAVAYRGQLPPLKGNGDHLLFFWATWCLPCKAALPELLALEREGALAVVAITDEPAEQLDRFFESVEDFPRLVASDEYRGTFLAYGVSGTPTFVLIDEHGIVRGYRTGYRADEGLGSLLRPGPQPAGTGGG